MIARHVAEYKTVPENCEAGRFGLGATPNGIIPAKKANVKARSSSSL